MVIQDDGDTPVEVSVMKTPHLDSKKYIIVQNHVREVPASDHDSSAHSSAQDDSSEHEKNVKKLKKPCNKDKQVIENKEDNEEENVSANVLKHTSSKLEEIKRDLEDLRTEFHECFHRLGAKLDNIVQAIDSIPSTHRTNLTDSNSEEGCNCKPNTKIIFDEDGQKTIQPAADNHTCVNKLKRRYSDVARNVDVHSLVMKSKDTRSLAVEYEEQNIILPEDLNTLVNILQDSKIAVSYRNKVIDKMRFIKQGHMNDVKFSKPGLVEKLKTNTDSSDIFEFKGANLFSLPGYPDSK